MAALDQILDIFCVPVPAWLGLVNGALGDISSFANGLVNGIVDKITDKIDSVTSKVDGIIDRMLNGTESHGRYCEHHRYYHDWYHGRSTGWEKDTTICRCS